MIKPWQVWTGRVLSAIPVVMMAFSAMMKLTRNPGVVQGFAQFAIPESLILPIGIIEVGCVVIYLIPPTAVLGAILIAGYLGGAVLTHWRAGQGPVALSPLLLGVFAWAGLWMRDGRIRELIPVRKR